MGPVPGEPVGHKTGGAHRGDSDQSPNQANRLSIVTAHDDMVHVAKAAGGKDQQHMDDDESDVPDQYQEMQRPRPLTPAKQSGIPLKAIIKGGRHGNSG